MIARIFAFLFVATSAFALPATSDLISKQQNATPPPAKKRARPPAPATRSTSAPVSDATVIVIDPGHGGFDRGGIAGQRVPEKTMNLDVAQRLKSILQASGYRVVMTRDSDVFIPLGTRVAVANQYRNAIFVCVHFNSASRRGANGIETYFYSSESLPLASAIHYHVNAVAPSENRGVRRRGYFVLRRTRIPAVLVECGFLTNPTEAQYAQSAVYRQKLAQAIADGIRSRNSVSRVATAGTVPLQPFIDQTRVRERKSSRSKSSKRSKSSSKKKSSKKKSSSTPNPKE